MHKERSKAFVRVDFRVNYFSSIFEVSLRVSLVPQKKVRVKTDPDQ